MGARASLASACQRCWSAWPTPRRRGSAFMSASGTAEASASSNYPGTAIWHHPGKHVPIRYVLVRDVAGAFNPQAFLCTDLQADPLDILRWFVRRWATEVTFAEVRRHLGVETQRQWSDKAIARMTPALLGLFSLVTLWTSDPDVRRLARPRGAAWYQKRDLTFSDALAAVRRSLWAATLSNTSRQTADITKVETAVLDRLIATLCYSA